MCFIRSNNEELMPIEFVGINNNERLMGSTIILYTKSKEKIYKVLKNRNFNEFFFYSSLKATHSLRRHKIVPNFLRLVKLKEIEDKAFNSKRYRVYDKITMNFKFPFRGSESNDEIFAIEMSNFFSGYLQPAIMDIKLGTSWIGESRNDSIYTLRNKYNELFQISSQNSTFSGNLISRIKTSIYTEMSDEMRHKLKYILKSFKQQLTITNSCQRELGVRIQGLIGKEECITRSRGKELTSVETMRHISEFLKSSPKLARIARKKINFLKSWLNKQDKYRFISTSLVLVFDRINSDNCDIRWLDFTHALSQGVSQRKDEVMNEGIIKGLNSILYLLDQID